MNRQENADLRKVSEVWRMAAVAVLTAIVVGSAVYWWQQSRIDTLRDNVLRYRQASTQFLRVYSLDKDFDHPEISFYVAAPENLPLLGKLRLLADKLSRFMFQNHPINVLKIEERKGIQIAIIDLREPDFPDAYTWRTGFFQGSTGGHFTTETLTKSFLQPDYEGDWIDGVVFYYQGQPIIDEWDHIALHGTILRDKK